MVENKCSEINECQNSVNASRWIRAANNPDQCPVISVTPEQYIVDNPETVSCEIPSKSSYMIILSPQLTLSLTQSLPPLLDGETYLCHFSSNEVSFTVDAVGSGTSYTCGRLPPQVQELSTEFNISFISSLIQIPFSTSISALTVYQCGATARYVQYCHLQVGCACRGDRCRWGEYVPKTTITAYAEWERCCCVNYTLNLLPIASDNQPAKCSIRCPEVFEYNWLFCKQLQ